MKYPSSIVLLASLVLSFTFSASAKPLKIACSTDYYPYAMVNQSGEMDGSLYDLWNLWSQRTGIPVTFTPMQLGGSVASIKDKSTDAICGIFETPQRKQFMDFSDPMVGIEGVLFVQKHTPTIQLDNTQIPIGVVEGDYVVDFLSQRYPQLKLTPFSSYNQLRDAVDAESIEAFVYDTPESIPRFRGPDLAPGYKRQEVLYKKYLRAAVHKENTELLERINRGLEQITNKEKLAILKKRGLLRYDNQYQIIGITVTSVLLAILLFLVVYIKKIRTTLQLSSNNETDWQTIIAAGENDNVEFKSSLRWDLREQKVNKVLEHVIAKTISAFLNSDGGYLFIGVDDNGNLLGLEADYASFSKKKNADGFLLALSSIINKYLGKKHHQFITVDLTKLHNKDICIVHLKPSDSAVFVTSGNKEEFFIRAQASSQPLGLKDTHEYISSKWSN